jgi:hypothetical protein
MTGNWLDQFTTADEKLARGLEALGRIEAAVTREFGSPATEDSPHLQNEVPANTTNYTDSVTWTAPDDGVITSLLVWHVPNSEDALRTRPVRITTDNRRKDIPSYPDDSGEEFITGEPDDRPYEVREPIREGEQIAVAATNTNANYAYRFAVVPTINYAADPDAAGGA